MLTLESDHLGLDFFCNITLWLFWVLAAARRFSSFSSSPVAGPAPLIAAAPYSAEHESWATQASVAAARGLGRPAVCGILTDQGSNSCPCIGGQVLYHLLTREVSRV